VAVGEWGIGETESRVVEQIVLVVPVVDGRSLGKLLKGLDGLKLKTTAGDFVIQVVRAWAPIGADRFFNLVRHGYYDDARVRRVVPGFITQWGVAGDPEVTAVWYDRGMPDDPVAASNVRGTVAFAFTDPGTRSTRIYINMVDNSRHDSQGFTPFGSVIEGLESAVDSIYSGYGEESGGGVRAGNQASLVESGNAYLDTQFPELDRIIRVRVSG
jgi:cyclophilin family peptidyl-prolyl cis-trans isomerase